MTIKNSTDVLIIGGGVIGLTAALAMRQRGFTVAVLEARDASFQAHERVYALNHATMDLLRSTHVWKQLNSEQVTPYRKMHIWDAQNGATLDFNAQLIARSELGCIVTENALKEAQIQLCAANNIQIHFNTPALYVQEEASKLTVRSEHGTWLPRFLMVADGANSPTRDKLNVKMASWSYHQHAIITTVETEFPHQNTAYQVFHADGPLAFLPLSHPNTCSIVWSTTLEHAEMLMQLEAPVFNQALTQAMAKKLGQIFSSRTRQKIPLHMRHTHQYAGQQWILLGDTAHTIHPLAGLGLNVGMADLSTWLKYLDANPGVLYSPRLLGAFQRERKFAVWQIIALMEGLKTVFSTQVSSLTALRNVGIRLINRTAILKKMIINYAIN